MGSQRISSFVALKEGLRILLRTGLGLVDAQVLCTGAAVAIARLEGEDFETAGGSLGVLAKPSRIEMQQSVDCS